jgi:hypothetical protein
MLCPIHLTKMTYHKASNLHACNDPSCKHAHLERVQEMQSRLDNWFSIQHHIGKCDCVYVGNELAACSACETYNRLLLEGSNATIDYN